MQKDKVLHLTGMFIFALFLNLAEIGSVFLIGQIPILLKEVYDHYKPLKSESFRNSPKEHFFDIAYGEIGLMIGIALSYLL